MLSIDIPNLEFIIARNYTKIRDRTTWKILVIEKMEKLSILETNRFKVNFVQINRKESFHPLVDTYNEIHIIEKIKCSLFFTFLFFFFFRSEIAEIAIDPIYNMIQYECFPRNKSG